jgi:hypothetical protein
MDSQGGDSYEQTTIDVGRVARYRDAGRLDPILIDDIRVPAEVALDAGVGV